MLVTLAQLCLMKSAVTMPAQTHTFILNITESPETNPVETSECDMCKNTTNSSRTEPMLPGHTVVLITMRTDSEPTATSMIMRLPFTALPSHPLLWSADCLWTITLGRLAHHKGARRTPIVNIIVVFPSVCLMVALLEVHSTSEQDVCGSGD